MGTDSEGKQALFSSDGSGAALGGMTVTCSHCGQESVLAGRQALKSLWPSLYLPRPRSPYRHLMRCPSCGRRTWVELRLGH